VTGAKRAAALITAYGLEDKYVIYRGDFAVEQLGGK
jgi:hypothetical protein